MTVYKGKSGNTYTVKSVHGHVRILNVFDENGMPVRQKMPMSNKHYDKTVMMQEEEFKKLEVLGE